MTIGLRLVICYSDAARWRSVDATKVFGGRLALNVSTSYKLLSQGCGAKPHFPERQLTPCEGLQSTTGPRYRAHIRWRFAVSDAACFFATTSPHEEQKSGTSTQSASLMQTKCSGSIVTLRLSLKAHAPSARSASKTSVKRNKRFPLFNS